MAAWLIPAISAAAGLVGNLLTNRANKKQAEYQYSTAQEQWNKANIYNTPQEQMLRLAEAGLNPNLVYGSGSVTGNTTSQAESYKAAKQDINLPNMVAAYQDFQLKGAQVDNVKAQTNNVMQRTLSEQFKQAQTQAQTAKTQLELDIANELKSTTIHQAIDQQRLTTEQYNKMFWDASKAANEYQQSFTEADIAKLKREYQQIENEYLRQGIPSKGSGMVGDVSRLLYRQGKKLINK